MRQLYLSWVFQRRPESMKAYFGFEHAQLGYAFRSRRNRPIEYVVKALHSCALLIARRPDVLWLATPPTVLLYVAFAYSLFRRHRPRIIVDCHNGTFVPRWSCLPFIRRLLGASDAVVVHNAMMREPALHCGVSPDRIVVLEDRPAEIGLRAPAETRPRPLIVIPCSFDEDEPVAAMLAAAARLPNFDFVLTGRVERGRGLHVLTNIPSNAKCPGYLPKDEFERLVASATAVCGLTSLEGCQLCAAGEAVGAGVPLVLSGTQLLRDLFPKGATYAESNSEEHIARACEHAVSQQARLRAEIRELRRERLVRWREQALPLRIAIKSWDREPAEQGSAASDGVDAEMRISGRAGGG